MPNNEASILFEDILDKTPNDISDKIETEIDITTSTPCWVAKSGVKTYPSGEPYIVLAKAYASQLCLTPSVSYSRFLYRLTRNENLTPRKKVRRNRTICDSDNCVNPSHKIFDHALVQNENTESNNDPWSSFEEGISFSQGI